MKKLIAAPAALVLLVQPASATVAERVDEIFAASTGWFVNLIFANLPGTGVPWIVGWLVLGALVFTFILVSFRCALLAMPFRLCAASILTRAMQGRSVPFRR